MSINKKSQIQMMETVIVLFIFFILLIFGFVFYSKFFTGSVEMEKKETVQLKAVQVAQKVMDLPELQCTKNNVKVDNCVDKYKLEAANNVMTSNSIHYFDLLGYSKVEVKQIHPIPLLGATSDWPLYEKADLSNKKITSSIFIPTIIYDPVAANQYCYIGQGSCSFGLIEVEVYS